MNQRTREVASAAPSAPMGATPRLFRDEEARSRVSERALHAVLSQLVRMQSSAGRSADVAWFCS